MPPIPELESVLVHLKQHDNRFDEHDRRFDELDRRLDEHDRRFDRTDEKLDGVVIRLENLQSTVQFLAEQMSTFIQANSDVKMRVHRLEESQQVTDLRLNALERR